MGQFSIRSFRILSALLFAVCFFATSAVAENLIVKLDGKGTMKVLKVPAGYQGNVTAYLTVKGNETQYLNFYLQGPGTMKTRAKSMPSKGAITKELNTKAAAWSTVNFLDNNGRETAELKIGTVSQQSAPAKIAAQASEGSGGYCHGFTEANLDMTIAHILKYSGITYTRDQLCELYAKQGAQKPVIPGEGGGTSGGNGGGSGAGPAYGSGIGSAGLILHKDTCGTKAKGSHLVRFDISLASVNAEAKAAGYDLSVGALDIKYYGKKAGTLKPTSDGKFAPRALFLLSTTGGWGGTGEKMTVVRWKKAKYSLQTLRVEDYVGYRGLSLARVVAEPALRGGKGTVEIQSGAGVYSVCFKLSKSRQRVNGYTN